MKTELDQLININEATLKKMGTEKIDILLTNYEIEIETGKRTYAGTDSNIYIKLYSDNNKHTELIKIHKKNSNDFEKGSITKTSIRCKDLGRISKVYIEHDNKGKRPGWFLEKINIKSSKGISIFEIKEWLSNKNKHIRPSTTVTEDSKKTKHIVIIETGEKKHAGTDAGVYIQLYGENGKMTTLQGVDTEGHDDFEKGGLGAYIIYSDEELGNINKIKVEHDNTGGSPWWFIKRILVDNTYTFTIEDWLGTDEPGIHPSKIYTRDHIESNDSPIPDLEPLDSEEKWYSLQFDKTKQVKVSTGDMNETIRLYDNGLPYSLWGRGGSYAGCGIDAANSFMGWFNKNITRSDIKRYVNTHAAENNILEVLKEAWEWTTEIVSFGYLEYFDHDFKWNDKIFTSPAELSNGLENLMEHKSTIDRFQTVKYSSKHKEYKTEDQDYQSNEEVNIAIIKTIKAHLENGAPLIALVTEGNHWITIVGIKVVYTDSSKKHISVDNTTISYIDMTIGGTVENLRYNSLEIYNWGSSWKKEFAGTVYSSYVDGTLITLENDLLLEPSEKIDPHYVVSITTGDAKNAGTDSSIFVKLYGENGESDEVKIDSICDDYERPFKHNSYQKTVGRIKTDKYLGKIYRIKVRSDGHGSKSGWLLKNITIEKERNGENESYNFTGGTWFENNRRLEKFIEENSYLSKYKISLVTGDVDYAGTDSAIYIQIFGELDKINPLCDSPFSSDLQYIDNPGIDDNERNTTSIHYIYAPKEMLDIEKVYIQSDGSGDNPGWFLKKAIIEKINQDTNEVLGSYNFTVKKWLKNRKPGVIAFEDLIKTNYEIKVKTGDVHWAGTGARVFIKLYGDRETEFIKLDNTSRDDFERGNTDTFNTTNIDVGEIEKVEIKHDNTGDNPGWFLEKIEVEKENNLFNFTGQRWLAEDNGLATNAIIHEDLKQFKYQVTMKTADVKKAGTDSNIYIKLYGEHEMETSLQRMNDPNINDFEQGQLNSYVIYSNQKLGEINKIFIECDNRGSHAGWKFESASIVLESEPNTKYLFNDSCWFDEDSKCKYFYLN